MKGSIIDDTTAIGKRLDELTSKQVAVIKTAAPPPRRLPVCLRCEDTGWMKDGHTGEHAALVAIRCESHCQSHEGDETWGFGLVHASNAARRVGR